MKMTTTEIEAEVKALKAWKHAEQELLDASDDELVCARAEAAIAWIELRASHLHRMGRLVSKPYPF